MPNLSVVDYMAQPTGNHEPTDQPDRPERHVTQDEFNRASTEWGAFVEYAGGQYYLARKDEVLVLDADAVVA